MKHVADYKRLIAHLSTLLQSFPSFEEEDALLSDIEKVIDEPVNVMILGIFNAGKSTLINTLLQSDYLETDIIPSTAKVTKIVYGDTPEVELVFIDGSVESHPLEAFKEISAEVEEGAELRKEIAYVIFKFPHELLKKINIIDTPGFEALHKSHTAATKSFLNQADAAYWVFDVSQVGTLSEFDLLKEVKKHVRPIGLINRIDEMDEDDLLDDIIENVAARLSPLITDFIGISALYANEALSGNDSDLLKESNWPMFLDSIKEQMDSERVNTRKESRILSILDESLKAVKRKIDGSLEQCNEIIAQLDGNENYRDVLKQEIDRLQSVVKRWATLRKESHYQSFLRQQWPLSALQDDRLQEEWEEQIFYMEEIISRDGLLDLERENLHNEASDLESRKRQLQEDWREYETSGLFGNEPILFTGRKRILEREGMQLDDDIRQYNATERDFAGRSNIQEELKRAGISELRKIAHKVASRLEGIVKEKVNQYNDKNYLTNAMTVMQKNQWIPEFIIRMESEILPAFMDLKDAAGSTKDDQMHGNLAECQGTIEAIVQNGLSPKTYNNVIRKIQDGLKSKDIKVSKQETKQPSRLKRSRERKSFNWRWLKPITWVAVIMLLIYGTSKYGGAIVGSLFTDMFSTSQETLASENDDPNENSYEVYVQTDGANIRNSPSLSANIVTAVPKGEQLLVFHSTTDEEGREWHNIQLDTGQTGWISGKIVSKYKYKNE